MKIRIVKTTPGEAPEEVRAAWVGLVLPVAGEGPDTFSTVGVLSRPKTRFGMLLFRLFRRATREHGYVVKTSKAIDILGLHSESAAKWWRQHAPHMLQPGAHFVFHAHVCVEFIAAATSPPTT